MLRIQIEFMHAQMQAYGQQMTTILEAFTKVGNQRGQSAVQNIA